MPSPKSSSKPKPSLLLEFEAIGTQWSIELIDVQELPDGLTKAVRNRIADFDQAYSRFRDDSLVTEMSHTAGNYLLPEDAQPMLDLYRDLYIATDGAMTPLIGQTLVDAGYDAQYSFKPKTLRQPLSWDDALQYNYPNLRLKQPALLDVGAMGKGYLVDIVAGIVKSFGVVDFVIDAGGDMKIHGARTLPVGLEHPDKPGEVIGVVRLHSQALCGSAGNRRKWADYHHIIDPLKLESPNHIRAVWVTADSTLLADALTTALFFVEPTELLKQYTFEYVIVRNDLSLDFSPGFPADFF